MNTPLPQVISDDLWKSIEPLIPAHAQHGSEICHHAAPSGRKPIDRRKVLSAIVHVLKKRISWRQVPKSFGSGATAHRYFEQLQRAGFFDALQSSPLARHPDLTGLPWRPLGTVPCRRMTAAGSETEPGTAKPAASSLASQAARDLRQPPTVAVAEEGLPSIFSSQMQARILKLHAATDVASLWSAINSILREMVPHNARIAYLDYLDHPKTWKAVKVLASSNAQMPAEWFEERWKMDITPDYILSHRGITCFRFSDIIRNDRELQRTPYFNQFFKPFGWHYTACVQFWRDDRINSAIALRRTKEQGDFRPAEVEFLKGLQPHIDTVLRRLLPSQTQDAKLRWLAETVQDIPIAVMFMDWSLKPLCVNREALTQCAIWNLGVDAARAYNPREVFRIPADFAQVCAELKAEWLRVHSGVGLSKTPVFAAKIMNSLDPARMATISLDAPHRETIVKPGFRVQFLHQSAIRNTGGDRQQNALQWRLTSAERELVQLASLGYDNTEIARRLNKSVNTVKHQFTSIYRKLGENSPRVGFLRRVFMDEDSPNRALQAVETPFFARR
jgi:DNA-binding CsgD family transcriptional regulator/transposase